MPIIDSKTGKIRKSYSIEELQQAADEMRGLNMIAPVSYTHLTLPTN